MAEIMLDNTTILNIVAKIQKHGEKTNDGYQLESIHLDTGFDGYSITLNNRKVAITINFHNTRYTISDNQKDVDEFYRQLQNIDEKYT